MASASKPLTRTPIILNASLFGRIHTYLATAAFATALAVGCWLHYKKIVKNSVAGYPKEWFPSVSATIGDWYPERSIFQILIALTAAPRFALVFFQYYLHRLESSSWPGLVLSAGLVRTLSCGGWVYITSTDDHDAHDIFMILYMICNIPWMLGGIKCTPRTHVSVRRKRKYIASGFFLTLIPLVYFFIQHKVHRIPGAYTHYSFCEWSLIICDVFYDSVAAQEFKEADLQVALGPSLQSLSASDEIENKKNDANNAKESTESTAQNRSSEKTTLASTADVIAIKYDICASTRPILSFVSDVYLSYVFWSIFTSLIPTLFYFSVWELGIAGQELALLATLSPIFLSIRPLRSWVATRSGQIVLHFLSLSGLAAYGLRRPIHRLFVVTFANIVTIIRQASQWAGLEDGDIGYQSILTAIGFLIASLAKHANHTNNPIWPFIPARSGGYNRTGIALALISLVEYVSRPTPAQPPSIQKPARPSSLPSRLQDHWLSAAIPLGSLIFTLHNMVSESSTLVAWSWTGYTNGKPNGPVPHLHSSLTLVMQCLGLILPILLSTGESNATNPLSHPLWFAVGSTATYALYKYRNWEGYISGLVFAFFIMSITPLVFQRAAATGQLAKTYTTAWLITCLLNLASIFTVAYAFVPGGVYFRERTNLVLIAQLACLSLAFRLPYAKRHIPSFNISVSRASYSRTLLACIAILSALVSIYRWPIPAQPFKPGTRTFNAGIWTIHFGIDNQGRDSQRGVRNLIRDMELDVVGLLETDLHRTSFGHRDLTRVVAEEMGYYVDLGPGPNSHTWGAVLLSKFPIINSTHHLLPSPRGELAPAIEAVLDIYGALVTVIVSHNGQEEDPLDRELQSKELARIMAAAQPRPVVFLGYVVTKPHAKRPNPYEILVEDGQVHDIDKDDRDRWCEYILYRGVYRTAYARLSRGIITDTELQVGQFVLPRHGTNVTNDSEEARYHRSWKEDVPKERWFPMSYYRKKGKGGVNGHYYHVFNTPLYYRIPEDALL
ncbi:hypothetical protein AX16_001920 [Volvariella volvacea WC 439]|nr:hypothetical protein AX16_001920 [Volvariella volvacea WC 439]